MKMNHDNNKSHFFASSVATWMLTTPERNLKQVLDMMMKEGYPFNLFLVPLPHDADYEINMYQPQVEGTQWLGYFEGESK
jgi:hypothetical protein